MTALTWKDLNAGVMNILSCINYNLLCIAAKTLYFRITSNVNFWYEESYLPTKMSSLCI